MSDFDQWPFMYGTGCSRKLLARGASSAASATSSTTFSMDWNSPTLPHSIRLHQEKVNRRESISAKRQSDKSFCPTLARSQGPDIWSMVLYGSVGIPMPPPACHLHHANCSLLNTPPVKSSYRNSPHLQRIPLLAVQRGVAKRAIRGLSRRVTSKVPRRPKALLASSDRSG